MYKSSKGGRESLSNLIINVLKEINNNNNFYFIENKKKSLLNILINGLIGRVDGVDDKIELEIIELINYKKINFIIIDGSNFGYLAKKIKNYKTQIKVITFFHNCEAKFFFDSLAIKKNFRALLVFITNFIAERLAVLYSDYLVCLSKSDGNYLKKFYGKKEDYVIPLCIRDSYEKDVDRNLILIEKYILFVGTNFYGNSNGILWFINNVLPRLNINLYIVGDGFEGFEKRSNKIKTFGWVESLSALYEGALTIIAPIFDGAGMKTKVAEAFMHGKMILGTNQAFSGYNISGDLLSLVCNTPDDFVNKINKIINGDLFISHYILRKFYIENHSESKYKNSIEILFKEIINDENNDNCS